MPYFVELTEGRAGPYRERKRAEQVRDKWPADRPDQPTGNILSERPPMGRPPTGKAFVRMQIFLPPDLADYLMAKDISEEERREVGAQRRQIAVERLAEITAK